MAYESGGYAEKLGNRFEGRWVVRQMLQMLNEDISSICVEAVGDDEKGVDLWIERKDGIREAQQCKGENGVKSDWSMADLSARGILNHLRDQLIRSELYEFSLVSTTPATMLRDLSRSARDSSGDAALFYQDQVQKRSKPHREAFKEFCNYLDLNPENPVQLEDA
ncbi:MAG: hypothetical protein M0T70_05220 [Geobacteraceae bacterium]|nr:hypothetical protein [Geobacteraceae bacterium]